MQSDPRFFTRKATCTNEVNAYNPSATMGDYYNYGVRAEPAFDATLAGGNHGYPGPLNSVEFQTAETCPKNFIIFDQTDKKSRIIFHPAFAQKSSYPSFDNHAAHAQENGRGEGQHIHNQDKSSSLKEDLDDIDALLSLEEDEQDEEDEVVSTGRTPGNYRSSSPDSLCSTDGSKSCKMRSSSAQYSASGSASSQRKEERMRKMVKALRGIIPGGDQMDTPAVLDEAVRYLKSLKVEVKKLGIKNLEN